MALFKKTRFMWYEPWFFQQRIRSLSGWAGLGFILAIVAALVASAVWFTAKPANPPSILELFGFPLGMAAIIWWVFDGTDTRRTATLDNTKIVVGGDMGKYSTPESYKIADIQAAAIVLPEESKWPSPALYFLYNDKEQVIGIDPKAGLQRLAQALHDAGIPMHLKGWEPNQQNEFERTFRWQAMDGSITPTALINKLPADEPGLYSLPGILWAIFLQCWALTLWLLFTCAVVYYSYLNWGRFGFAQAVGTIGIPIGGMLIAGSFTDRYATAATSKALIRGAKSQISRRSQPLVDPHANSLIPVEVFTRDQYANTIQKIYEMGFVQIDSERKRVIFEGKNETWVLPSESVRSLAIEEIQVGTAGQSALGGLNYYVTILFASTDGDIEYGLRYSDRDFGEVTDTKRATGALGIFESIETILPFGSNGT